MEDRSSKKLGFTLIELLVVIAIIGLLGTVAIVALSSSRAKARDTKRLADIKQLQKALELYYDENGSYITGVSWPNDCSGNSSFGTALTPLVSAGFIASVPHDPFYPTGAWPNCYYYQNDTTCGAGDSVTHPYIFVITTEVTQLNFTSWNLEANRWCLYP